MIICRATQEHYDKLIQDGWTDKHNNIKNKNSAFDLSFIDSKEIYFVPESKNSLEFEDEFINNRHCDIVELINNEWVYIQKYENVINRNVKIKPILK